MNDLFLFKAYVDTVIVTGAVRPINFPLSCWISVSLVSVIGFSLWWKFWPKVREPMYTVLGFVLMALLLLIVFGLPMGEFP